MQHKRSVLELRRGGRHALCSSWLLNTRCCSSRSSSNCCCPLLSLVFAFGLDHMGVLTAMQAVRRQSEPHTRRVEEQQLQHQACTCCTQHGQACSELSKRSHCLRSHVWSMCLYLLGNLEGRSLLGSQGLLGPALLQHALWYHWSHGCWEK
jgi:hypothetical protein